MRIAITPEDYDDGTYATKSLDEKIGFYDKQVRGWQFSPAQTLIDRETERQDVQASFAILHIITSYFESVATFQEGYRGKGQSEYHFQLGFISVFHDELNTVPVSDLNEVLSNLYSKLRCGLYHSAQTGRGIIVTYDIAEAIQITGKAGSWTLYLNPKAMLPVMRIHHANYITSLKDPSQIKMRTNFQRRLDWLASQ